MAESTGIGIRELCREIILGYCFWSIFWALPAMIWFYPLNAMEVSGYEVCLLVLFSPVILGISSLRKLIQTTVGLGLFRILSLVGVASFNFPDTLSRLLALSFGNATIMIVLTASLWSTSSKQRYLTFWGLMLGLFALLTSRIWYQTFVPTWNDSTSNNVVLTLMAIATLDKIISGDDGSSSSSAKEKDAAISSVPWFRVGVGFGSLLFLTQWVFGEVSVAVRWGVKPNPDTGPMPYPWGFAVLVALNLGMVMSSRIHNINRLMWLSVGIAGLVTLYYLDSWYSLLGAIVLGIFTMSLWPVMTEKLLNCPPARTMTVVVITWMVEILHEIWTVAYNFVPGGVFTREHTDHLIVIVMAGLALGYFTGIKRQSRFTESRIQQSTIVKVLMLFLLIGGGGYLARHSKQTIKHPPKVHPKADFSAGVWAFHFGYDNQGWPSMVPSSKFIRDSEVDVIGLLESDASKPFLGNHDLGMWLGEELGMYVDFGLPTKYHCWGVAFLSKYPIVKSTHHYLPSPHGELAPAILATVNMTGHLVDFLVTHMGNEWDALDRELQAKELAKLLSQAKNPVVFLGYVTSKPGSRDYKRLISWGNVRDIDDTDKKRFCEYIMYRGLTRLGYARISHGGLSDTELQVGKFRIPENLEEVEERDVITTDPAGVDPDVTFNPLFGRYRVGHNWMQQHQFHMSTPKYFLPSNS